MHLLPTRLGKLAEAAEQRDNTRFAVTAINLALNDDGTFKAEATDTKIAVRVFGSGGDASQYPTPAAMTAAPNGQTKGLIPVAAWKRIFGSMGKVAAKAARRKPILGNVAVKLGKDVATFGATDLQSSPVDSTPYEAGKFPPVEQFIPKAKYEKFRFKVDARLLARLLTTVADVAGNEENLNSVIVSGFPTYGDGDGISRIKVDAKSPDGSTVDGLLVAMPLDKDEQREDVGAAATTSTKVDIAYLEDCQRERDEALAEVARLKAELARATVGTPIASRRERLAKAGAQ